MCKQMGKTSCNSMVGDVLESVYENARGYDTSMNAIESIITSTQIWVEVFVVYIYVLKDEWVVSWNIPDVDVAVPTTTTYLKCPGT